MTVKIGYDDERFIVEQNKDWTDGRQWEVRDTATGRLKSRHVTSTEAIIAKRVYINEREL